MLGLMRFSVLCSISYVGEAAPASGNQRALLSSRTVVAFAEKEYSGWEQWDWDTMTHLAFWKSPDDKVRKQAKKNGVLLFKDNKANLDPKSWTDKKEVSKAIDVMKKQIEDDDLDGIFFDYEGNGLSKDQKQGYTDYVTKVKDAIAPKEIFVCVGGRPTYEWRDYDYKGLAKASSFLFIMGYDMHFWDDYTCVTKGTCSPAEAPLKDLKLGVQDYLKEVSADKLVLGLPWYAQRYTQVAGIEANQGQADLKDVWPIVYGDKTDRKKSDTLFDNDKDYARKLMCNGACIDGKKGGVIWWDDHKTLAKKYEVATDNNLQGIGIWEITKLDYSGKYDKYVEKMWKALKEASLAAPANSTIAV